MPYMYKSPSIWFLLSLSSFRICVTFPSRIAYSTLIHSAPNSSVLQQLMQINIMFRDIIQTDLVNNHDTQTDSVIQ